jgi:hypothetical protein
MATPAYYRIDLLTAQYKKFIGKNSFVLLVSFHKQFAPFHLLRRKLYNNHRIHLELCNAKAFSHIIPTYGPIIAIGVAGLDLLKFLPSKTNYLILINNNVVYPYPIYLFLKRFEGKQCLLIQRFFKARFQILLNILKRSATSFLQPILTYQYGQFKLFISDKNS